MGESATFHALPQDLIQGVHGGAVEIGEVHLLLSGRSRAQAKPGKD